MTAAGRSKQPPNRPKQKRIPNGDISCFNLAFSTKKDGSMRICLNPQRLNNSLKRCAHRIPTVEELNPQFAKAKVFSKLEATAGCWAIHLEKKSQLLTTFRTPFGRFGWLRLPFRLNASQDIFQSRMDQHLDGLTGVVFIADDIVVLGENEEDHDRNLTNLIKQAERKGLEFNSKKCHFKQSLSLSSVTDIRKTVSNPTPTK